MTVNYFEDLSPEERAKIPRNLITTKGTPRCRFELFTYYPETAKRKYNPYTYRGDMFGITDPSKMLQSLLKFFIKDYYQWHFAELYDNLYPYSECNRMVLELKNNRIITNRLQNYEEYLKDYALPDWLKTPIPQPNK